MKRGQKSQNPRVQHETCTKNRLDDHSAPDVRIHQKGLYRAVFYEKNQYRGLFICCALYTLQAAYSQTNNKCNFANMLINIYKQANWAWFAKIVFLLQRQEIVVQINSETTVNKGDYFLWKLRWGPPSD